MTEQVIERKFITFAKWWCITGAVLNIFALGLVGGGIDAILWTACAIGVSNGRRWGLWVMMITSTLGVLGVLYTCLLSMKYFPDVSGGEVLAALFVLVIGSILVSIPGLIALGVKAKVSANIAKSYSQPQEPFELAE
jgi:hypothetical protein